jgi:hypothetical protein
MADVELYTSPWVTDTRAAAYFGPVAHEATFRWRPHRGGRRHLRCWCWLVEDPAPAAALDEVLDGIRARARALGANAIVGLEVSADPFAGTLHAVGTAAKLEPLIGAAA